MTLNKSDIYKFGENLRKALYFRKKLEVEPNSKRLEIASHKYMISQLINLLPEWAVTMAYCTYTNRKSLPKKFWEHDDRYLCGIRFSMCHF